MSTGAQFNLGKPISADQVERDAVHIAVLPVITSNTMTMPGDHVGIRGKSVHTGFLPHVGIIDPFLRDGVLCNTRVYLFMYPNTTQNVRHDWSHPAVDNIESETADDSTDDDYFEDDDYCSRDCYE